MATQVVDTDGHIFETDEIIFEYLEPPYRGRKELLALPFFPGFDGFHRMVCPVGDGRPYVIGADDPKTWLGDRLQKNGESEKGPSSSVSPRPRRTGRALGRDPWAYGLGEANHKNLEALMQYSYEQGFIGGKMALEELFAEISGLISWR